MKVCNIFQSKVPLNLPSDPINAILSVGTFMNFQRVGVVALPVRRRLDDRVGNLLQLILRHAARVD